MKDTGPVADLRERLRPVHEALDTLATPIKDQPSRIHPDKRTDAEIALEARRILIECIGLDKEGTAEPEPPESQLLPLLPHMSPRSRTFIEESLRGPTDPNDLSPSDTAKRGTCQSPKTDAPTTQGEVEG